MINYAHWYPSKYPLAKLSDSPIPACDNAGNICVPIYNPKIQIYHEVPDFEGGAYPSIGIQFIIIITIGSEIIDWESQLLREATDEPVSDVTDYFGWTNVGDTFNLDLNLGKIDSIMHQAGVSTCNLRILTCTRCLSESYGGNCSCSSTTVSREVHFGWRDKYESSMSAIAVSTDLKPEKVGSTRYSYTCDIDFNLSDLTAVFRSTDPINMPPGTACDPIPPPEPPPIYDCWGEIKATSDKIYGSASGTGCLYSAEGVLESTASWHLGDDVGLDRYTPSPTLYKNFTHRGITEDQLMDIRDDFVDAAAKLETLTPQNALPYVRIQDNWIYTKYYSYFWYSEGDPDIVKPDYIEVWPWIPLGTSMADDYTCTPYHEAGSPPWEVIWADGQFASDVKNVYKKALYDVENPSQEQLKEYNAQDNHLGTATVATDRGMRLLSYCTRQLDDKFLTPDDEGYGPCRYVTSYRDPDTGEWEDPPEFKCQNVLSGHLRIIDKVTFENVYQGLDPMDGSPIYGDVEWYELESWPQGLRVWCSADCYEGREDRGKTIGVPTEKPFIRTYSGMRHLCSNFDVTGRAFIDNFGRAIDRYGHIVYNGIKYQRAECYHWSGPSSRVYTDNTKIYHKFMLPLASCTDRLQGTNSNRPAFYEVYADTTGTDTEVYLGSDINSTDYAGRYTVWESATSNKAKCADTEGNEYLYVGSADDVEVVYATDTEVSQLSIIDEEFE